MYKVNSITVQQLIDQMEEMEAGDVLGIAGEMDENGEGSMWYGLVKLDLSLIDEGSNVWVLQIYGGFGTPDIISDWDDLEYDMRKLLDDWDLLQEEGTVLIDENDLKGVSI